MSLDSKVHSIFRTVGLLPKYDVFSVLLVWLSFFTLVLFNSQMRMDAVGLVTNPENPSSLYILFFVIIIILGIIVSFRRLASGKEATGKAYRRIVMLGILIQWIILYFAVLYGPDKGYSIFSKIVLWINFLSSFFALMLSGTKYIVVESPKLTKAKVGYGIASTIAITIVGSLAGITPVVLLSLIALYAFYFRKVFV